MSASGTMRPSEAFGWAWTDAASRAPAPARRQPDSAAPGTRARSGLGPTAKATIGLAATGTVALFCGFLTFVACLERDERVPQGRADGIVALTGGAQRIGDAIDLLANGYGRRLLITGVNERTSRDEIARLNPTQRHWIDCCVDLDYRARNTIGNAIETRRWMRQHRFSTVTVVTSNYHMPRTMVELDHALMGADRVVPHPVIAEGFDADRWWHHPSSAKLLASEYLKFLVAWVRTRFEHDPERSRAAILIGRGKPIKMVAEPLLLRGQE
ncbi:MULTISPECIES: YdcF family protein [unclassified Methylobacterium]|uniref:YdcF family protein n=1 Tax=unclassified Methylobacterium TaxID=2615210 RepID=UPI000A83570E|nr:MULTISPECIES: YdcF family protein [unclassified Methylobacterium]